MSFNLKNLNMTCAPMYNAQSNNEIMGYMCNSNSREGFESSSSTKPVPRGGPCITDSRNWSDALWLQCTGKPKPQSEPLIQCNPDPSAAPYPNFDLPKSFPSPIYANKNSDGRGRQFTQSVKYDENKIINSFDTGIVNNPSNCNVNYWIPLFYQSNLMNAATGYPDPNVMAIWLSVNDAFHPGHLIVPDSTTNNQGIVNYNNIMSWFAKYPTLTPGFMICFTTNDYSSVYKSFYVKGAPSSDKKYANYTSFTPKYSYTYADGAPVEPGFKRIDDDSGDNSLLFYLGPEGKKFWDKHIDKNLNYFDEKNIHLFGQPYQGIELTKVAVQVKVCAIQPDGSLYNWSGPPSVILPKSIDVPSDDYIIAANRVFSNATTGSIVSPTDPVSRVTPGPSPPITPGPGPRITPGPGPGPRITPGSIIQPIITLDNTKNIFDKEISNCNPKVYAAYTKYKSELNKIIRLKEKLEFMGTLSQGQQNDINNRINKAYKLFGEESGSSYDDFAKCFNLAYNKYSNSINPILISRGLNSSYIIDTIGHPMKLPKNFNSSPDKIIFRTPNKPY